MALFFKSVSSFNPLYFLNKEQNFKLHNTIRIFGNTKLFSLIVLSRYIILLVYGSSILHMTSLRFSYSHLETFSREKKKNFRRPKTTSLICFICLELFVNTLCYFRFTITSVYFTFKPIQKSADHDDATGIHAFPLPVFGLNDSSS